MERKLIAAQIRTIRHCNEMESELLAALFQPCTLQKGQLIQIAKTHFRSVFFVCSGLIQLCQQSRQAKTKDAKAKPLRSLAVYQPSELFFFPFGKTTSRHHYQLHAITPCQLFLADYPAIEKLIASRPSMMRHYVAIGEYYLQQTFQHLQLLQQPTAIHRYEQLAQRLGKHFYQIPNEYKASYLGISRKHLTRISKAYLRKHTPSPHSLPEQETKRAEAS